MTDTKSLSYFDSVIGKFHNAPETISTSIRPLRVVPTFGIGAHTYTVQTFRQRDIGDTIALEVTAEGVNQRIIIPPAVANVIARQRNQLNTKSRSRAGKRIAEDRAAQGLKPGFMEEA